MISMTLLTDVWVPALVSALVSAVDKAPAPEDVKAGWVAFAVFIALGVAVTLLGFSLTRHLRTARSNAEQGVFGPTGKTADEQPDRHPENLA
jgi:hypothetical protein